MDRWWSVVVRPLWGCYKEPPDAGVGWHLLACCPHAHAPATFFVKRLNISFVLNWLKVEVATVRWVAVCVQVTESTDLPQKNSNRSGRNPGGMMRLCGCLMAILAVSVWIFFVVPHYANLEFASIFQRIRRPDRTEELRSESCGPPYGAGLSRPAVSWMEVQGERCPPGPPVNYFRVFFWQSHPVKTAWFVHNRPIGSRQFGGFLWTGFTAEIFVWSFCSQK